MEVSGPENNYGYKYPFICNSIDDLTIMQGFNFEFKAYRIQVISSN